ncbi:MAG: dihydrofolate reductase [Candidatus Latescibacteria bacterium]|nr:dihydrofolate reductase [Candidatus Latescibacterota bacterium]
MILISAMSTDRVIGSGEGMPWSVPEEYQQFLRFIKGQTVIMGRRSYEIFGPDLTSAHNLVVSRSGVDNPDVTVCAGIEEAVARAKSLGKTVFSAGGASIYRQTLPLASAMYLSYIKGDFTGDAYFPEFSEDEWDVSQRRDHEGFEFVEYKRKS